MAAGTMGCKGGCPLGTPEASRRVASSCGEPIAATLLLGVRQRGFAHPGAVLPRLHAVGEAIAVALAVAVDDVPELAPVDLAEIPVP